MANIPRFQPKIMALTMRHEKVASSAKESFLVLTITMSWPLRIFHLSSDLRVSFSVFILHSSQKYAQRTYKGSQDLLFGVTFACPSHTHTHTHTHARTHTHTHTHTHTLTVATPHLVSTLEYTGWRHFPANELASIKQQA